MHVSHNLEIKNCDSGTNIFIIDRASRRINKEGVKIQIRRIWKNKRYIDNTRQI